MVSWQNNVLCISNFALFKVIGNLKLTQWFSLATKCFATNPSYPQHWIVHSKKTHDDNKKCKSI
jgi:hypothetical protein